MTNYGSIEQREIPATAPMDHMPTRPTQNPRTGEAAEVIKAAWESTQKMWDSESPLITRGTE